MVRPRCLPTCLTRTHIIIMSTRESVGLDLKPSHYTALLNFGKKRYRSEWNIGSDDRENAADGHDMT
jgi:hypothetical protein